MKKAYKTFFPSHIVGEDARGGGNCVERGYKKGFTLVELIVVVTILVILGTVAFLSLQGYTKEARDAKRISDTRSLLAKINMENIKGIPYDELIEVKTITGVIIDGENAKSNIGIAYFENIKEEPDNFKDPLYKYLDYPIAYAVGQSNNIPYSFVQIATFMEKDNTARLFGNYYPIQPGDSPSLFISAGFGYIVDGGDPSGIIGTEPEEGGEETGGTEPTDVMCFLYTIDNDEVTITDYLATDPTGDTDDPNAPCPSHVVIPSKIEGKDVTIIGGGAFAWKSIRSVKFPNTVRLIEESAFKFNLLTQVIIPNSVKEVQNMAFGYNEILTYAEISTNIVMLGELAFCKTDLKNVKNYDLTFNDKYIYVPHDGGIRINIGLLKPEKDFTSYTDHDTYESIFVKMHKIGDVIDSYNYDYGYYDSIENASYFYVDDQNRYYYGVYVDRQTGDFNYSWFTLSDSSIPGVKVRTVGYPDIVTTEALFETIPPMPTSISGKEIKEIAPRYYEGTGDCFIPA